MIKQAYKTLPELSGIVSVGIDDGDNLEFVNPDYSQLNSYQKFLFRRALLNNHPISSANYLSRLFTSLNDEFEIDSKKIAIALKCGETEVFLNTD